MNTKTLTKASIFCALITIFTIFIKIPIPNSSGYFNFGDTIIILASYFLPLPFAPLAAAIGSGLGDIFVGAGIYIIPTIIIKSSMGYTLSKGLYNKTKTNIIYIIFAEIIMVLGYFILELLLFNTSLAIIGFAYNALQGILSIIIGYTLLHFAKRIIKKA